jgi:magnesium transporter
MPPSPSEIIDACTIHHPERSEERGERYFFHTSERSPERSGRAFFPSEIFLDRACALVNIYSVADETGGAGGRFFFRNIPYPPAGRGMDVFVYFSKLLKRPVVGKDGRFLGMLFDLAVETGQVLPQACTLLVKAGTFNTRISSLPWEEVAEITDDAIRLKRDDAAPVWVRDMNDIVSLTLRRDVLDQQVVDTYNHKVVRVNDVHLLNVGACLLVAHVDVSSRGLLRRLGFEKIVDAFVRLFNPRSRYLKEEHLISWKYIHPLAVNPASMTIQVDAPQKKLAAIHAADLADIFLDLPLTEQIAFFKPLEPEMQAKIFMNVGYKTQNAVAEELNDEALARILRLVPPDEATDFLEKSPERRVNRLLTILGGSTSRRLSQLLGYASDSAGGLMTSDFLSVNGDTTVARVIELIRERKHKLEVVQYVYIVDHSMHLLGATNYRRILLADPKDEINRIRLPKTYYVHLDSSLKEVAYLMEKYKYNAIPVVDEGQVMQGIITVDDILEQLIALAWRRIKRVKVVPAQMPLESPAGRPVKTPLKTTPIQPPERPPETPPPDAAPSPSGAAPEAEKTGPAGEKADRPVDGSGREETPK